MMVDMKSLTIAIAACHEISLSGDRQAFVILGK
jgi:hypothetical protein